MSFNFLRRREVAWRLALARDTSVPLQERLVLFWANHLTVSEANSAHVSFLGGPYEREAIRPHVLGRFEDMLLAAALHPAMLFYLNNVVSFGRNAPEGRGRGRGVNENLAREILELHALGADGGYAQADVTAFAETLSGWVVGYPGGPARTGGESPLGAHFQLGRHEPGTKRILGRDYPEAGPEEARAVLRDLARHPATARHVARRMAAHFVADAPPPALVDNLARSFIDTGGDLRAMTATLIRAPESWTMPARKLRPPLEFVMAAARVTGRAPEALSAVAALRSMGQPWQRAPSPRGWDESDDGWATPDGVKTRLDWARRYAETAARSLDPRALAEEAAGPGLSETTRRMVAAAESPEQGLALLLLSPELQRR